MNKTLIVNTALTAWDEEDHCFVTRSPHADISGAGDTPEEAEAVFKLHLQGHWEYFLAGIHGTYNKIGRPALGRVDLHTKIRPETKDELAKISKEVKKSQGEIIEILLAKLSRNEISL